MSRALPLLLVFAIGCAPSIAPSYRDYRVETASAAQPADVDGRLRAALAEAGWEIAPADAPNVISTRPRRVQTGVLSRVDATLDLAPVGGGFVRVYVHAIRRNVFGSRSKQPYLSPGLRRAALADLTTALASRGLTALDAPRERDEEATD